MNPMTRHRKLLNNVKIRRWYENLEARSKVTSQVYLRNLGLWLEYINQDGDSVIEKAKNDFDNFKGLISDQIRKLEKQGIAGSSISTSIKPLISYLKFNNVVVRLGINIANENRNFKAENERIPTSEELGKILRVAGLRERLSISLMAFSGLRPEVLGNIDGTDGLRIKDIPDLRITNGKVEFEKIPARIIVRPELSKIRLKYFSFLGEEGCRYLKEYLETRNDLNSESPLIEPESDMQRNEHKNEFLMTTLLLRRIKAVIEKSGFDWRPYIFRVYFGTNLDIAESKGLISHAWRQFLMGHKGDIEETYTRREGIIEEGREAYQRSIKLLETVAKGMSEEDVDRKFRLTLLTLAGFSEKDIKDKGLLELSMSEIQSLIKDRLFGVSKEDVTQQIQKDKLELSRSGSKQKVISISLIEQYIGAGFEFLSTINSDKAIVRLP